MHYYNMNSFPNRFNNILKNILADFLNRQPYFNTITYEKRFYFKYIYIIL